MTRPVRRVVVPAGTAVVLTASLLVVSPLTVTTAAATVTGKNGHLPEQTVQSARALPPTKSVPGHDGSGLRGATTPPSATRTHASADNQLPAGATGTARFPAPASGPSTAASAHPAASPGMVRAGALPVHIGLAALARSTARPSAASTAPSSVTVTVATSQQVSAAGVNGLILTLQPTAPTTPLTSAPQKTDASASVSDPLSVSVSREAIASSLGANAASRARLVQLPACVLTTPELAQCRVQSPMPTLTTPAPARPSVLPTTLTGVLAPTTSAAEGGTRASSVVAVTAGSSGPLGDYAATSLAPSGKWSAGGTSGSFSWSYPITLPAAVGGQGPQMSLDYTSASQDGRTSAENGQASWVGDGWDYSPGYVERSYKPCAKDGVSGSADLCWAGQDVVTLSLGGMSSSLVRDGSSSTWRLADDDGSTVELLAGADNGDGGGTGGTGGTGKAGEYWKITTPDGTAFYLGSNHLPTGDGTDAATNSAWTVPVFGDDAGEPCKQSTFNASSCAQAWRWNLDYVVDPHGNLTTYAYTPETNAYARGLDNVTTGYTRGGVLKSVAYGQLLATQVAAHGTAKASATVTFTAGDRCLKGSVCRDSGTGRPTGSTNWPDTPIDQACYGTATCATHTPTFWSTQRLTSIATAVLVGASYRTVDTYDLVQTFPATNDGSDATLWLSTITRTGTNGGTAKTLPSVTFDGTPLPNRVDGTVPAQDSFNRFRLTSITTETGGRTTVSYSLSPKAVTAPNQSADPCSRTNSHMPASADSNSLTCFPVYWTPQNEAAPVLDWFNKYLVKQVTEVDTTTLHSYTPDKVTTYEYQGGAAWHRDDSELTETAYRTWAQFRGYATVVTRTGVTSGLQTQSATTYYRGMDQNVNASGAAVAAVVTDSTGATDVDDDWLAGTVREQATYTQSGGSIVSTTITDPWASAVTASHARSGLPALKARMTNTKTVQTRDKTAAGTWRVSRKDFAYDSNGQVISVDDRGDGTTTAPRRCTTTSYATAPAGSNMVSYPSEVVTFKGACTSSPTPATTVTGLRSLYDGSATVGTGLTAGDATTQQSLDSYSAGVAAYTTVSTSTYDSYGRTLTSTDGVNQTDTTTYTPAAGALPTSVKTKNPKNWVTTTTYDPARNQPLVTTDPNGRVTTVVYDVLGRLTSVWLPGQDQATEPASLIYTYSVPGGTTPVTITSQTLRDDGVGYIPDVKIYDGLFRLRQEQTDPANAASGRIITDTFYDSHGWVVKTNNPYFNNTVTDPSTSYWVTPDNQVPGQVGVFYDGMGRTTTTTYSALAIEQWRTTTAYPGLDRTDVTPPAGGTASSTFSDGRGHATARWTYNTATPTGSATDAYATTYAYDAGDHLTGITDASTNTWAFDFDYRGRQTSATDPDAGASTTSYDNNDQVTSTTTPAGTLRYTYDELGRKTGLYKNTVTTANQLTGWAYDLAASAKGYLSSSSRYDHGSTYTRTITGYSTRYQPTGSTVTIPAAEGALAGSYTTASVYTDTSELLDHTTYPAAGGLPAETVGYAYNPNGPLSAVGGDIGGVGSYYQGDIHTTPFGEVDRLVIGPNPATAQIINTFDDGTRRLLSSYLDKQSGTTAVDGYTYTYNAAGDVTSVTDQRDTTTTSIDRQCYTYDAQHRLTQAWTDTTGTTTAPAPKIPGLGGCTDTTPSAGTGGSVGGPSPYWLTWTYDAVGNRTTQTNHSTTTPTGGGTTTYTQPAAGTSRPHSTTGATTNVPASTANYGYNTAGQLTSRPGVGGGTQTLSYTPDGHLDTLTQDTGTGAGTTTYLYDADGTQLIRRSPGHTTLFLGYEDLDLATTGASTGTITGTRYYPGPSSTITRTKTSTASGTGTLTYQFATDGHGTNGVSLTAGTLTVTRRDQTPYGTSRGTAPPPFAGTKGFVGGTTDTTTSLTLLGARNYDPTLGSFTTTDPLLDPTIPAHLNAYSYAYDNPISSADPTGLAPPEQGGDRSWMGNKPCPVCAAHGSEAANTSNQGKSSSTSTSTGTTTTAPKRGFAEGARDGAGQGVADVLSSFNPADIVRGASQLIHHFSFTSFFSSIAEGVTHYSDLKAIYNAWQAGDTYSVGYYVAKYIVQVGADVLGTLLGASAAKAIGNTLKGISNLRRAANGAPVAERLFTSPAVGVDSRLLGHSYARGESGLLNQTGSRLKFGWTSSGEFGGGWHLRLGVGRSPLNPNQARFHWDFGSTHVPNDMANDLLHVIRGVNGLQ